MTVAHAPIHPVMRALARGRGLCTVALAMIVLSAACATGFGGDSALTTPTASVLGTISLEDPVALSTAPPVCTKAVVAADTDGCVDATFTPGSPDSLQLGSLSGTDVQAAALTWKVTTTSPTGYVLRIQNAGAAPFLAGPGGAQIADMQGSPKVPAGDIAAGTRFGIAVGDAANAQGAVVQDWVGAGGVQGSMFAGLPTTPIDIAQRNKPQTGDATTVTFAATSVAGSAPAPGHYAGLARVTASII